MTEDVANDFAFSVFCCCLIEIGQIKNECRQPNRSTRRRFACYKDVKDNAVSCT